MTNNAKAPSPHNRYSHDIETVLEAFSAAYDSALANYEAAAVLAEHKHFAQSSSLSILALEEVGKMMLLDGLLFARTGDERYKLYTKGHLSHTTKLDVVELYPLFLDYLMTVDPRKEETRYSMTMVLVITDLKAKREKLARLLGKEFGFPDLNDLKQRGFYSHEAEGAFKANKDGIDPVVAKALLELTWRVTDSLTFVLGRYLENYKEQFRALRDKIDQATLDKVRKEAPRIVANIFGPDPDHETTQ